MFVGSAKHLNYLGISIFRRYNENQVLYSLSQCLNGGAEVGVHISLVIIFWCCYNFIKMGSVSSSQMSLTVLSVSVLGYVLLAWKSSSNFVSNLYQTLKTSFLFIVTGFLVQYFNNLFCHSMK